MRQLVAGMVGGFALFRFLRGRRQPQVAQGDTADPRAEDLRQKLAQSRTIVEEREEFEAAETTVDEVEPLEDPETRRRAVHESARATAEQMRKRS